MNLPPQKCLVWPRCLPAAVKNFTHGLGAVKLTKKFGMKPLPTPEAGGPESTSQAEGISTDVTGLSVRESSEMISPKGARTGPEKEKPKIASMMWSLVLRADAKLSLVVNGSCRFWSWILRRWCPLLAQAVYVVT